MRPSELLQQLESEIASADRDIAASHRRDVERVARMRRLTKRQTDAFVDLSQHYLPDLSQTSLADAWQEVRGKIRDVWLQKNDKRRSLKRELAEVEAERVEALQEIEKLREELDQAKVVLSCKAGNYRKLLREDPAIIACNDAVQSIDADIEQCLTQLEAAQQEAASKLPDYEASSLFRYLRDRQFGTPAYKEKGIERRWDRWVAKLIGYKNAKRSFDHLRNTPSYLKDLIDEKQRRYRSLLESLEEARERVMNQFGVPEQTEIWQALVDKVEQKEDRIESMRWQIACLEDDLYELENLNGEYYREALGIYRQFLRDLDPEILRVYAACTDSPVDDEICARLRKISDEIVTEQNLAANRTESIHESEKYVTALRDLAERLRSYARKSLSDLHFFIDVDLADLIHRIRYRDMTPDYAWRIIRGSMVRREQQRDGAPNGDAALPVEACYLAASEDEQSHTDSQVDVSGTVLLPELDDDYEYAGIKFRTVAICATDQEANYIVQSLAKVLTLGFAHTRVVGEAEQGDFVEQDEIHVMVESQQYESARNHLMQLQEDYGAAWTCGGCATTMDAGYALCWRCGSHRTP